MQQGASQPRSQALSFGILGLFDLTGLVIYVIMRRALAVRKPRESTTDTFQEAARLISRAHGEAVSPLPWDKERYARLRDRLAAEQRT